jgi:hypothetical protein
MSTSQQYDPTELDEYDYKEESGRFRRFLWFCAGADLQLLRNCPHSDRVKMEGIGGIVLATALLAFFSGISAAQVIFAQNAYGDILAFITGLVWAIIIFNLDRFIVTSTGHGDGTEKITFEEIKNAIPRIILGIAIGVSLSAPLEIRIMKPEIEAELKIKQEEHFNGLNATLIAKFEENHSRLEKNRSEAVASLKNQEDLFEKRYQDIVKQRKDLDDEASGKAGNKRAGEGPGWKTKKLNLDNMMAERDVNIQQFQPEKERLTALINKTEAELETAFRDKEKQMAKNEETSKLYDGVSRRIEIAHEIAPGISRALFLLLLALEITPIFIKMMLIQGPYDLLAENQKAIVNARYGIETNSVILAGNVGRGEQVIEPVFHQAETIQDFEVGKLKIESSLAQTAQQVFLNKTSADIQANPEKYIKKNLSESTKA